MRDLIITQYLSRCQVDPLFQDVITAIAYWGKKGPVVYLRVSGIDPAVDNEIASRNRERLLHNSVLPAQVFDDALFGNTLNTSWLVDFLQDEQRYGLFHVPRTSADCLMTRTLDQLPRDLCNDLLAAVASAGLRSKRPFLAVQEVASSLGEDFNDIFKALRRLSPFVEMGTVYLGEGKSRLEITKVDDEFLSFMTDKERSGRYHVEVLDETSTDLKTL